MITEPKLEHRPVQPYVAIRRRVPMSGIAGLPPLWDEVYAWLASRNIEPADAPFWNYRVVDMEGEMEIDTAVPVAAPVSVDGEFICETLPAGRYVSMSYFGPYEGSGLMDATRDLLAWADANGITFDKQQEGETGERWVARIESYITDPMQEPDSARWQTNLHFKTTHT